jgi:hypothetical protein
VGKEQIKVVILFEHKSFPVPYPHIQVLRYLLKIWETNIKQSEGFYRDRKSIFRRGGRVKVSGKRNQVFI